VKIQAAPKEHLNWMFDRTGFVLPENSRAIEAVDDAGRIAGMVAYYGWTPNACWMHVAIDSPAACRGLLRTAFEYPFNETGRGVVLALIAASNPKSLGLASRLGFSEVARILGGWGDYTDLILLQMRRESCRWISQQRKAA
jgi:RimJ/RimL family protein N-acetyltransferase